MVVAVQFRALGSEVPRAFAPKLTGLLGVLLRLGRRWLVARVIFSAV